ncbi:hypothetical protein L9F63_009696 [Diploptera punctata]|uniref:Uncharacterized protein n=1 Tax=Diploptera punctata TaxID=6984 RepID=A0AAD8ESE2_DIPPU|nr:hypothetical protein L9F63_009696 [Diploptera punctata]
MKCPDESVSRAHRSMRQDFPGRNLDLLKITTIVLFSQSTWSHIVFKALSPGTRFYMNGQPS